MRGARPARDEAPPLDGPDHHVPAETTATSVRLWPFTRTPGAAATASAGAGKLVSGSGDLRAEEERIGRAAAGAEEDGLGRAHPRVGKRDGGRRRRDGESAGCVR